LTQLTDTNATLSRPIHYWGRGWGFASCTINFLVLLVLLFYEYLLGLFTKAYPGLQVLSNMCTCLQQLTLLSLSLRNLNLLWEIPTLILAHLALIGCIYYMGKYTVTEVVLCVKYPDERYVYLKANMEALVDHLKVLALSENKRIRITRHQETMHLPMNPSDELSESASSLKIVGPISWLYIRLSAYLLPQPSLSNGEATPNLSMATKTDNQQVVEGSIAVVNSTPIETKSSIVEKGLLQESTPVVQAEHLHQELATLPVECYRDIYILGALRVEIGKVGEKSWTIIIKSKTQRLLFAYIVTADKLITWENIEVDVYEPILKDKNTVQRRRRLEKDARHLRDLFRKASEQAGLLYIDPIIVEGKGPGATWHLAAEYQLKDIAMLKDLQKAIETIKMGKAVNIQSLRVIADNIVMSYEHFLASDLDKNEILNWALKPYHMFREMYREIVWDIAKIEHEYGLKLDQHTDESKVALKRAAMFWEKYAFKFMPQSVRELGREGKARLSESALKEAMSLYLGVGDEQSAQHVYHSYNDFMRRRFPGFEPDSKTIEILSKAGLG
jgi:hypothetical protein